MNTFSISNSSIEKDCNKIQKINKKIIKKRINFQLGCQTRIILFPSTVNV